MTAAAPTRLAALLIAASLSACAHKAACPPQAPGATAAALPDWHDVITDPDHLRLRDWRKSFVAALAQARAAGHGPQIDREGRLLDPDTAMDGAALPVGNYRCRTIKLGAKGPAHDSFIAYPAHHCVVHPSGRITRLIQTDGLQRADGRLYPDSSTRELFLGTMILGEERKPIAYGRDVDRDMVGAVQRVDNRRWRMLLPDPAWESKIDVMELVPQD